MPHRNNLSVQSQLAALRSRLTDIHAQLVARGAKHSPPAIATYQLKDIHAQQAGPSQCVGPLQLRKHEASLLRGLPERYLMQWCFGDWERLAQIELHDIELDSHRERLALLAACALMQMGERSKATLYIYLAEQWGCSKPLIALFISFGLYNHLGRVAALCNKPLKAQQYLESAINLLLPGSDQELLHTLRTQWAERRFTVRDSRETYGPRAQAQTLAPRPLQLHSAPKRPRFRSHPSPGIFEWRPPGGGHNFGDHLGLLIPQLIYSEQTQQRIFSGNIHIHGFIGSLLSNDNINAMRRSRLWPILVACGYRGQLLDKQLLRQCSIFGCRGPLSQIALRDSGVSTSWIGDPALLLPLVLPTTTNPPGGAKSILVPHVHDANRHYYDSLSIGCDHILQALTRDLSGTEALIRTISLSSFVLAGAMHAAIVACAYDIPFAFFDSGKIDCQPKWFDFALSIGLESTDVTFCGTIPAGRQWYNRVRSKLVKPPLVTQLHHFAEVGDLSPGLLRAAIAYDTKQTYS